MIVNCYIVGKSLCLALGFLSLWPVISFAHRKHGFYLKQHNTKPALNDEKLNITTESVQCGNSKTSL